MHLLRQVSERLDPTQILPLAVFVTADFLDNSPVARTSCPGEVKGQQANYRQPLPGLHGPGFFPLSDPEPEPAIPRMYQFREAGPYIK